MKNVIIYIILILTLVLLFSNCEDEPGIQVIDSNYFIGKWDYSKCEMTWYEEGKDPYTRTEHYDTIMYEFFICGPSTNPYHVCGDSVVIYYNSIKNEVGYWSFYEPNVFSLSEIYSPSFVFGNIGVRCGTDYEARIESDSLFNLTVYMYKISERETKLDYQAIRYFKRTE